MDIVYDPVTAEKEYTLPGPFDGVSDDDGVITGTTEFGIPADVDITRPAKAFVNGAFVKPTLADTGGSKTATFTIAPMVGDSVIIYYWPTF